MRKRNKKNFWDNVVKNDDHWLWIGAASGNGHGAFRGRPAHQVAYELQYNIKLTKDDVIHHREICLIKLCVFGPHLERTTKLEHPDSLSTINRNKTHCKNGHEFTQENTYWYVSTNGWGRACKQCHALSGKRRRRRHGIKSRYKNLS